MYGFSVELWGVVGIIVTCFDKMLGRALWLVAWLCIAGVRGTTDAMSEALAGSSARLTCDVSTELPGDALTTVSWYRADASADDAPIYTYDARGSQQQPATRWSDHALTQRIYMRLLTAEAHLTIDPVDASDEAQYRCQVDFRRAPSRTVFVNLTVVGEFSESRFSL